MDNIENTDNQIDEYDHKSAKNEADMLESDIHNFEERIEPSESDEDDYMEISFYSTCKHEILENTYQFLS